MRREEVQGLQGQKQGLLLRKNGFSRTNGHAQYGRWSLLQGREG